MQPALQSKLARSKVGGHHKSLLFPFCFFVFSPHVVERGKADKAALKLLHVFHCNFFCPPMASSSFCQNIVFFFAPFYVIYCHNAATSSHPLPTVMFLEVSVAVRTDDIKYVCP